MSDNTNDATTATTETPTSPNGGTKRKVDDAADKGDQTATTATTNNVDGDAQSTSDKNGASATTVPDAKKAKSAEGESAAAATVDVDPELAAKIMAQVDFYFSDANYPQDPFLKKTADEHDGHVPIATLLKFNRLKALTEDAAVVAASVAESDVVQLSDDRLSVTRRHELPADLNTAARTLYTNGYPTDTTWEAISEFWNKVAPVAASRIIRDKSHRATGAAYVVFKEEEGVTKALESTDLFNDEHELEKKTMADYDREKAERRKSTETKGDKEDKKPVKQAAKFTPGCIVKVAGLGLIDDRAQLQKAFEPFGDVAFVDYGADDVEGKVRFSEPDAVQNLLDAYADGKRELLGKVPQLSLLEGEEEEQYWEAIIERSAAKKGRKGGRGRGRR